jgi:hypothetical protein
MAVRLSALRTSRVLLPKNIIFSTFGTHYCWRLRTNQCLERREGVGTLKKIHPGVSNPRPFGLQQNDFTTMLPRAHKNGLRIENKAQSFKSLIIQGVSQCSFKGSEVEDPVWIALGLCCVLLCEGYIKTRTFLKLTASQLES